MYSSATDIVILPYFNYFYDTSFIQSIDIIGLIIITYDVAPCRPTKSKNFPNLIKYFSFVAGDFIAYRYNTHGSDFDCDDTIFSHFYYGRTH